MAATITLSQQLSIGSANSTLGTGNLGSYLTGGVSVAANLFGLGNIDALIIQPTSGYSFVYNSSTGKILAYGNGGVAAHTHDFLVIGGQIASTTNDVATYAGPVIGKQEAANVTVAGASSATKGGMVANTVAGGTIIGAEVDNATDLSSVVFNWRATGN
jgi:hypothetical protein